MEPAISNFPGATWSSGKQPPGGRGKRDVHGKDDLAPCVRPCVRVDAASFLARSSFLLSGREGALRWVWLKQRVPCSRVSCAYVISSSRDLTRLGVGW